MRLLLSICSLTWFAAVLTAQENSTTENGILEEPDSAADLEAEGAACNAGNTTQSIDVTVGSTWIFITWEVPECELELYNLSYQVNVTNPKSKKRYLIPVNLNNCEEFVVENGTAALNLTTTKCNNEGEPLRPCTEYEIDISALHIVDRQPRIFREKILTTPDAQQKKLANLTTQVFKDRFSLSWANSSCPLPRSYNITLWGSRASKETVLVNGPHFSTGSCEARICRSIQPCSEYNVTIIPVYHDNKYQRGVPSETRIIGTESDSPYAQNVTFPLVNSNWFIVQWELQDCRPSQVQGYKLFVKSGKVAQPLIVDLRQYEIRKPFAVANVSTPVITLVPCTNYSIAIRVVYNWSSVVETTPDPIWHSVTTAASSESGSTVQDIQLVASQYSFNVSWKSPSCDVQVDEYHIRIINKLDDSESPIFKIPSDQRFFSCDSSNCTSVRPCTTYTVSVTPVFQRPYSQGKTSWKEVTTLSVLTEPVISSTGTAKEKEIVVEWGYDEDLLQCVHGFRVQAAGKEAYFTSSEDRIVSFPGLDSCTSYNVTVHADGFSETTSSSAVFRTKDTAVDPTFKFSDVAYVWMDHSRVNISWRFDYTDNCFGRFKVTIRRETEPQNQGMKSGDHHNLTRETSEQYLVHQLDRRVRYQALVTMWTRNNDFSVTSEWISIFHNEPMSTASVALIGLACVLVVVVVVVAVYTLKSRQRNSATIAVRNGGKTLHPLVPIRKSRPIKLADLPKVTAFLTAMRNLELEKEYHELKLVSQQRRSTAESERPENKRKNRYINILPYDDSRVKLSVIGEDPCSDYINASYVEAINGAEEFIAAQGPLENTVTDFWRMIWEQEVHVIVMLTCLLENGKVKCSPYWPDADLCQKYGSIKLENMEETVKEDWVVRKFKVIHGNSRRTVFQYHFLEWPDFGSPEDPLSFLDFVQEVRGRVDISPVKKHILVHCSAGVGRTGTFIAIDLLMQQVLRGSSEIDIFGTVVKLRSFRTHMVQTEDQYSFVYNCVSQFAQIATYPNQDEDYDNDSIILLKDCRADNDFSYTDDA